MTTGSYHHGDLRNALLAAGTDLAREGGPTAVGVRAAARSVGVSPTAAYRHFRDHSDLLGAVCAASHVLLARCIAAEVEAVPPIADPAARALRRFRAVGRAYIRFALAEPGLFRTAFAPHTDPPAFQAPGAAPDPPRSSAGLLVNALEELAAAGVLAPGLRPRAQIGAWAAVHGLAVLLTDGPLAALPPEEQEAAIEHTLDLVAAGTGAPATRTDS